MQHVRSAPGKPVAPITPTPAQLVIRCLAERHDGYWQAFSLEFGLAVQADTLTEARRRLESMIESYVFDALVGVDRQHASELLSRKASWSLYAKYYLAAALSHAGQFIGASKDRILFSEPLRLQPMGATC
jgi:predicted RNase H-like HicB family nuclease